MFKLLDEGGVGTRSAGKSGLTLVVTPFTTNDRDLVLDLERVGMAAKYLDGDTGYRDQLVAYRMMREGDLPILYCTAEVLKSTRFRDALAKVPGGIRLLVLEEAHRLAEVGPGSAGLVPPVSTHQQLTSRTPAVERFVPARLLQR